jgi:FkbM family methyltransferase
MDLQKLLAQEDRSAIEAWVKKQTQVAYVGDQQSLCRVLGRYLMYTSTQDLSLTPHLMLDGFWEMWITMRVSRFLRPGMRCIDVGANVGYYTVLMADFVGAEGHVQAWEPNYILTALLERSLQVNGLRDRVEVVPRPALDRKQEVLLRLESPGCWGSAFVVEDKQPRGPTSHLFTGDVFHDLHTGLPLDDLSQDHVDFVKVDAEGSEDRVWDGAAALRARSPSAVWLVEFNPSKYSDPKGFLEKLGAEGRRLAAVGENGELRPAPATSVLADPYTMLWVDRPA